MDKLAKIAFSYTSMKPAGALQLDETAVLPVISPTTPNFPTLACVTMNLPPAPPAPHHLSPSLLVCLFHFRPLNLTLNLSADRDGGRM